MISSSSCVTPTQFKVPPPPFSLQFLSHKARKSNQSSLCKDKLIVIPPHFLFCYSSTYFLNSAVGDGSDLFLCDFPINRKSMARSVYFLISFAYVYSWLLSVPLFVLLAWHYWCLCNLVQLIVADWWVLEFIPVWSHAELHNHKGWDTGSPVLENVADLGERQWSPTLCLQMFLGFNSQKSWPAEVVVKTSGSYSPKTSGGPRLRTTKLEGFEA